MNAKVEVSVRVSGVNEFVFSFPMAPTKNGEHALGERGELTRVLPIGSSVLAPGVNAVINSAQAE